MRILAVVPARGGSKRIKDKNLQEINGKSLVALACEAIPEYVEYRVLSTDDERIAEEGKKYGMKILWRPAVLSEDSISAMAVWQHAAMFYEWDRTILLQPCTPTRVPEDIKQSLYKLDTFKSACTVSKIPDRFSPRKSCDVSLHKLSVIGGGGRFTRDGACFAARQDGLWDFYADCGAVISHHPQVNIDEPLDLEIARLLMSQTVTCDPRGFGPQGDVTVSTSGPAPSQHREFRHRPDLSEAYRTEFER